jgi:acetyl esterase/lipase
MDVIKLIIQILAAALGSLAALISLPLFFRFRWPAAGMWILKVYVSALSPAFALLGVLTALVGLTTGSLFVSVVGMYDVLIFLIHIISITRPPGTTTGFEQAFGFNWQHRIPPNQKAHFLPGRVILKLPDASQSRLEQNISFATIPGTGRKLLCDVWQPPENVQPSGLAFIYLHGSAFYFLDKDFGTRPLFRHLAAQGHIIMDVAYRLAPETDIMGMVQDVKRAIGWMKEQAGSFGVDTDRIVLGGGSAGGHLALLAAYTANNPEFAPTDLEGKNLHACAVISLYGSNDLQALYYHTRQHLTARSIVGRLKKTAPTKLPGWMIKSIGKDYHRLGLDKNFENVGALAPLLGGRPDECPERYAQFSPVTHIHSDCPPTLLVHGEHDMMAPVSPTRRLYNRLSQNHVPVVLHILPQTDHGFDLVLPAISPAAHNAIYDVERFLAIMASLSFQGHADKNSAQGVPVSSDPDGTTIQPNSIP